MDTHQLPGDVDRLAARRERHWQWGTIGLAVLFALLGSAVVTLFLKTNPMLWLVLVGYVVFLVLVMGSTIALIQWRRRRGSQLFARSPLWEVGYRERSRILKAIRRHRPVEPQHRALAVRAARQIARRGSWPMWLYAVIGVLEAVNIAFSSGFGRVGAAIIACAFIFLAGYFGWMRKRARIYEQQHGSA